MEGLGAFANNVIDLVARPTGCAGICVHHPGHADTERSRGHSSFSAALDGSIKVEMERSPVGPAIITVIPRDMRSAPSEPLQFQAKVQELPGQDNFRNPISEPVLHYLGVQQTQTVRAH